jgi:O-antigen/teichoic acid export membrane protein
MFEMKNNFLLMVNSPGQLTNKKIFLFWLPLAATWIMMSVEGPYLAALIARSAEPKYNLAAYGVAYSLVLIIEAPIIMIMSASIALVKGNHSFRKLRNFTYGANFLITLIMLLLIVPDIFFFITEQLIGLPENVSELTHIATMILLPWPGAIGYRRFYQGLLINKDMTRRVAYGTIIRLIAMSLTAILLYIYDVRGVIIGATALSSGVMMEAIAIRIMSKSVVRNITSTINDVDDKLSYREIYIFYYPLALTSIIGLGVQPLVTFFVGQSRMAIESLAVLPVVTSFVFIFRALGLSYQEVVIALIGERNEGYEQLKKFALVLAASLVIVLGLFALTPLADFWFITVSGLSDSLSNLARLPLMIMFFFPALTVLISIQRGLLVSSKYTKPVTTGTITEFITIVILLFILIKLFGMIGAVAATISFVAGRIAANIYLMPSSIRSLRR